MFFIVSQANSWAGTDQNAPKVVGSASFGGSGYDGASSIRVTPDNGYIAAGTSYSIDGDVKGSQAGNEDERSDIWVVKLDSSGEMEWQKSLGGAADESAASITLSPDGGYVVAGETASIDGDVEGNHGQIDFWIVKLDSKGALEWQKCLGGTKQDSARSIQTTKDGGYIVAGVTNSSDGDVNGLHGDQNAEDFWVVKLDAQGLIEWEKTLGSSHEDAAYSVRQTKDGGYVVAGMVGFKDGDVSSFHGNYDAWVAKLDSEGKLEWERTFGGSSAERAMSIDETTDGGYVFAGVSAGADGDVDKEFGAADYWVVKLNSQGEIEKTKVLGGSDSDIPRSARQTPDGGYLVVGETSSNDGDVTKNYGWTDFWAVKLDSNLDLEWQKSYGGSGYDEAYDFDVDGSGYIVAGASVSDDHDARRNNGDYDFLALKLQQGN
jgi:hypothetical protein